MSTLFIIAIAVATVAVLAWNFIPALRTRMRGWTTVLDNVTIGIMPIVGDAIDAFEGTDWKAYVPENYWPWIISTMAAWSIFKRIKTNTGVGARI